MLRDTCPEVGGHQQHIVRHLEQWYRSWDFPSKHGADKQPALRRQRFFMEVAGCLVREMAFYFTLSANCAWLNWDNESLFCFNEISMQRNRAPKEHNAIHPYRDCHAH